MEEATKQERNCHWAGNFQFPFVYGVLLVPSFRLWLGRAMGGIY